MHYIRSLKRGNNFAIDVSPEKPKQYAFKHSTEAISKGLNSTS